MSNELGIDRSGNNNNWTVNNMTLAADQMLDSPTNNFATFNPLAYPTTHTTLSEGNLSVKDNGGAWSQAYVTQARNSGKVYVEFMMGNAGGMFFGITTETTANNPAISFNNYYVGSQTNDFGFRINDYGSGQGNNEGYSTGGSFTSLGTAQPVAGGIYQLAFDLDNAKVYFGKNNTWFNSANPSSGSNGISISATENYFVTVSIQNQNTNAMVLNAGQDSSFAGNKTAQGNGGAGEDFYYTPPSGFKSLRTKNLPAVAVTPSEHFNAITWTGASDANLSLTGVGFQPDLVWIKKRTNAENGTVWDAVRGAGKSLCNDNTSVEVANYSYGHLESFDADGFTTHHGGDQNTFGYPGNGWIAWNWKANGSGSSNTAGSINTTATSVNTDAGFSMSTYTGTGSAATIGHGLSKAPEMIIVKNRSNERNWRTYHKYSGASDPETDFVNLDTTEALADYVTWNDTAPTADVFSITSSSDRAVNYSGDTYVSYCFHSVDGYSKIGKYTGNDNADGTFVYCGFRPAWVLIKNTNNSGEGFVIMNNKSDPSNVIGTYLTVYDNSLEQGTAGTTSSRSIDFVSNGFKLRGNSAEINDSETIIFLAFAETPFKYANAR